MGFYSISFQKKSLFMEGFHKGFHTAGAAVKCLILPRDCCVFELQIFLGALNQLCPDYQ